MSEETAAAPIDTDSVRKVLDKWGPPLSPMLLYTLLDEIDRLNDQIAFLERTFVQPVLDRINRD